MKKIILITLSFVTAAVLTVGSSFVSAQDTSTMVSSTTASTSANAKDFQDRKARILQHINNRITKMQQIQSCVQAAEDLKALQACKSHRDKGNHSKIN
jgi:multidrug efflux pump subunit AcrB